MIATTSPRIQGSFTTATMRDRLQSKDCARRLKALADPERLKIVQCLQTGAKNVTELSALLGAELANVSHHVRVLRNAKLVCDDKQGKFVVYSLNPDVFRPRGPGEGCDCLDLGCCRLELTGG
jgi:ArsR family transcriptional regulator